jgi:glycerol kinase
VTRILAIDQGTTSTRGLVFDGEAAPLIVAGLRHRQSHPLPGWVEHDPCELLANVRSCIAAAGPIKAIAIANQGESCLAWDAITREPLSPVIVWQDSRTSGTTEALAAAGHAALVARIAGVPLDCYFSASKLAWLVRELPAVRAALTQRRLRLGTTDAFLIDCLTGTFATDATTASRTSLMDLDTLDWDPVLCRLFGVPIECLPPIRPTAGDFGSHDGVPITVSVVDQQAALHGHGARRPGDAKITFGTGAFVLVHAGRRRPSPTAARLTATVAWDIPGDRSYALEGGVYDAGAAIEWAKRIGLVDEGGLLDNHDDRPAIDRGILFVPALSGLAGPRWRRDARGCFSGMTVATTRADLQHAILEGIALQTCEVLAALQTEIGLGESISVDGGMTANAYFLQFLADASGRIIRRSGNAELTAYGGAVLAGHRAGPGGIMQAFVPRIQEDRRRAWIDRYSAAVDRSVPGDTASVEEDD